MRISACLFFISLIFFQTSIAQEYKLQQSISPFEGNFTTDYLGNIFRFVSGDVIRYDLNGIQTGIYSSREFGDVHAVDASNPMKILVVFEKFSTAVLLDNNMSANTTIRLSLPGIPVFSLIATSRDGGFWIFDPQAKQLKKMNEQLTIIAEGTNMRQITDNDIIPSKILDSGNWIVLATKNNGYMIFDRYGTYYKTINEQTGTDFQVTNDELMFKHADKMMVIDVKRGTTRSFLLPENVTENPCRVENKRIYVHQENSLKIYSY
jgi:hypothetical protein